MNSKSLGVYLCIFFMFPSCGNIMNNVQDNKLEEPNINASQTALNNTSKKVFEESDGWESGSYSTLLQNYISIDSMVFVGKKTIKLDDLSVLKELSNISQETIADFIEKNKTSKIIENHFDVYAKTELIEIKDSIDETIKLIKKKYPKSEGIILLSKIGTNTDHSQTLIYMEHYDLSGNLHKKFCITFEENGKVEKLEWFPLK